jgi:hypothetical protein
MPDKPEVDMTPMPQRFTVGGALIAATVLLYIVFF